MQSMNLTTAGLGGGSPGTSVVGGIANGLQVSPGQVQSTSSMGGDFPSKSFFDIFVDVNIGTTNLGTLTLENTSPLLVQASGLTSLPPTVIYTHTNSTPAPLRLYQWTVRGRHIRVYRPSRTWSGLHEQPSGPDLVREFVRGDVRCLHSRA